MGKIFLETVIHAPVETCFELSLDVNFHERSAASTQERAIAGVTRGILKLNDEVTWEARHFGFRQQLSIKISEYNKPYFFKDIQINGIFKKFEHSHYYTHNDRGTLMRDEMIFECPMGLFGKIADPIVEWHLRKFLLERNKQLKQEAEKIN